MWPKGTTYEGGFLIGILAGYGIKKYPYGCINKVSLVQELRYSSKGQIFDAKTGKELEGDFAEGKYLEA